MKIFYNEKIHSAAPLPLPYWNINISKHVAFNCTEKCRALSAFSHKNRDTIGHDDCLVYICTRGSPFQFTQKKIIKKKKPTRLSLRFRKTVRLGKIRVSDNKSFGRLNSAIYRPWLENGRSISNPVSSVIDFVFLLMIHVMCNYGTSRSYTSSRSRF